MLSSSFIQTTSQLNNLIDFKPIDTKESVQREGLNNKNEKDVRIYCLNCMPGHIQRDMEELRMFEYSYCYHNFLLNFARQKASQNIASVQTSFQNMSNPAPSQILPAVVSNTYLIPPSFSNQPAQPSMPSFNTFPTQNFPQTSNPNASFSTPNPQPFPFNTYQPTTSAAPAFNLSAFATKPPDSQPQFQPQLGAQTQSQYTSQPQFMPQFQNQPQFQSQNLTQPQLQPQFQSQFGLNSQQSSNFNISQQNAAHPPSMSGLSSIWNSNNQSNIPSQTSLSASQQNINYPSSHLAPLQPAYIPYPPYYAPRYQYPPDPYGYMRPPFDPYSFMYRDATYSDSNRDSSNLQKLLMQRQAAQALWQRYGVDPDIPISDSFGSDTNKRRMRSNQSEIPNRTSAEPIIHVVPTLAGFKDGKQQIILNIEETADNRSYIPKIFNPNSEISFTITSRDNSANRSYLASITNDSIDQSIGTNLAHNTAANGRTNKDLPKPLLNTKLTSKRKSILDMELSDYHVLPKIDTTLHEDSTTSRRVTFQTDASLEVPREKENSSVPNHNRPLIFSPPFVDSSAESSVIPVRSRILTPMPKRQTSPTLGGTLTSFNDSLTVGSTFQSINDSQVSISRFKWTPSWFISKLISGFVATENAPPSNDTPTITDIIEPPSCGVILTRDDYYTRPPLSEIDKISSEKRCVVHNFVVGRYNIGKVLFHGDTDVFGLNLDKIISINNFEIEVYRDDEPDLVKPPLGAGLNKPATLTLFNVFPQDSDGQPLRNFDKESLEDFEKYLKNKAAGLSAEFVDYLPDSGSFSFIVQHFTKYSIINQYNQSNLSQNQKSINLTETLHMLQSESPQTHPILESQHQPNHVQNLKSIQVSAANQYVFTDCYNAAAPYKGYSVEFISPYKVCIASHRTARAKSAACVFQHNMELMDQSVDSATKYIAENSSVFPREIVFDNQSVEIVNIGTFDGASNDIQSLFTSFLQMLQFCEGGVDEMPTCKFNDCAHILEAYVGCMSHPVFSLIKALYTDCDTFTCGDRDSLDSARVKHFSEWVTNIYSAMARQQSAHHILNGDPFAAALSLISVNLFSEAIQVLVESNNHRMAAILSCYARESDLCARQLDRWLSDGMHTHIHASCLKIWMLLSHVFVLEQGEHVLHVCESFDYIRCLSLFINFSSSTEMHMINGLNLYMHHFKTYPSLVAPPVSPSSTCAFDIKYHIISYFTTNQPFPSEMLDTDSYTLNPLDYSLAWHVFQILNLLKPTHSFPHEFTIAHSYACQLETIEQWHFSILVLLFLRHTPERDSLIRNIINRHVSHIPLHLPFLRSLHIPSTQLYRAQAQSASYHNHITDYVNHMTSATLYKDAYIRAVSNLAPTHFLNKQYQRCLATLLPFESVLVNDGHFVSNGKVLIDVCRIHCGASNDIMDVCVSILNRVAHMDAQDETRQLCRHQITLFCLQQLNDTSVIDSVQLAHLFNCLVNPQHLHQFIIDAVFIG